MLLVPRSTPGPPPERGPVRDGVISTQPRAAIASPTAPGVSTAIVQKPRKVVNIPLGDYRAIGVLSKYTEVRERDARRVDVNRPEMKTAAYCQVPSGW